MKTSKNIKAAKIKAAKNNGGKKAKGTLANVYLQNILLRTPGSIYWKDKNGVYLGCNQTQAMMANCESPSEIVGKTDYDFSWKDIADELRKTDCRIMETGIPEELIEAPILANGQKIIMHTVKAPLYDTNNNIIGIIGTSIDITKQKEAEKAIETAYKSKSEFIAIASHEIRSYITNIIYQIADIDAKVDSVKNFMFSKVLETINDIEKASLLKDFDTLKSSLSNELILMKEQAMSALESLTNLGNIHYIQENGIEVKFEEIKIQALIDTAIDKARSINKEKRVSFVKNIDNNLTNAIEIDYLNTLQSLISVISNAIRYSQENSTIVITATKETTSDTFIKLSVQDFGCGMLPEQLANLFNSILNKESTTKSLYKKASLKLSQAKIKIEASGGSMTIDSVYNQGTKVTFLLSYRLSATNKDSDDTLLYKNSTILLIEDDPVTLDKTKNLFSNLGFTVVGAQNSREAKILITKNLYNLYLVDISLPDSDGVGLIKFIRSKKGELVPIVVITSHTTDKDKNYFESCGATLVEEKPIKANKIEEILKTLKRSELL